MHVSIVRSGCSITDTSRKFFTLQDFEFWTITFAFSNVCLIAGYKLFKQIEKLLKSRYFGQKIKPSSIYLLKNSLINKHTSLESSVELHLYPWAITIVHWVVGYLRRIFKVWILKCLLETFEKIPNRLLIFSQKTSMLYPCTNYLRQIGTDNIF